MASCCTGRAHHSIRAACARGCPHHQRACTHPATTRHRKRRGRCPRAPSVPTPALCSQATMHPGGEQAAAGQAHLRSRLARRVRSPREQNRQAQYHERRHGPQSDPQPSPWVRMVRRQDRLLVHCMGVWCDVSSPVMIFVVHREPQGCCRREWGWSASTCWRSARPLAALLVPRQTRAPGK